MTGAAGLPVVVPTRGRPGPLAACLDALEAQTAPSFEVVVVDDASLDGAAVAAVVAAAPHARLVAGAGRGPAAARNAGTRQARAPVVCFTDDDCRPEPAWLAALARRLDGGSRVDAGVDAGVDAAVDAVVDAAVDAVVDAAVDAVVDAVAGATRNGRPDNPFAAASQAVTNHLTEAGLDPTTGALDFAPTSNLACRRDLLEHLAFDERYPLAAGEDRDWCARLAAQGRTLAYEPAALVVHHQQLSARSYWRQQVRYGRGAHRFRVHTAGPRLQRPRFYAGLLRRGMADGPTTVALIGVAQIATATGLAIEVLAGLARHPPPAVSA